MVVRGWHDDRDARDKHVSFVSRSVFRVGTCSRAEDVQGGDVVVRQNGEIDIRGVELISCELFDARIVRKMEGGDRWYDG